MGRATGGARDDEVAVAVAAAVVGGAGAGTAEGDASKRAIFRWGAVATGDPKLPSSSMKRFGVLMMRSDTVLTTGIMNCLMFFRVLRTPPTSEPPPAAAPPFSSLFWAPFLARCNSCLAMVASVRLEDGTILTGFRWRGLLRRPAAAALHDLGESEDAGGQKESWPSPCWGR